MDAPVARISPAARPYSAGESAMMPPDTALGPPALFCIYARNYALGLAAEAWAGRFPEAG